MVGQLGAKIGESILAKLMSSGVVHMSSEHQGKSSLHTSPAQTQIEVM